MVAKIKFYMLSLKTSQENVRAQEVVIEAAGARLIGDLCIPDGAQGAVVFAHGSGSSRKSSRNRHVAGQLNDSGLATLLFDLLTVQEERDDAVAGQFRFDIGLLADRLTAVVDWVGDQSSLGGLSLGLFGASTGAAAALSTAARRPSLVRAVVSRGGRPDLAADALPAVQAPTLLIVGGRDEGVIELNRQAAVLMKQKPQIAIVPGATHLFEEPGTLDKVADLARRWFTRWLSQRSG